jgi:hypothetical protein
VVVPQVVTSGNAQGKDYSGGEEQQGSSHSAPPLEEKIFVLK